MAERRSGTKRGGRGSSSGQSSGGQSSSVRSSSRASKSSGGQSSSGRSSSRASNSSAGRSSSGRSSKSSSGNSQSAGGSRAAGKQLSGREAIERVRQDLPELIGRSIEGVLSLEGDDGGWKVTVQVVELARIPNTTDVLGAYEITLDRDGELVGYRRIRRFHRGQADED